MLHKVQSTRPLLEQPYGSYRPAQKIAAGIFLAAIMTEPILAAPYLPAQDKEIVADLPTAASPEARNAQALQRLLERAPNELELALKVAGKDIDLARAQSDPRFSGYAEGALAPWWSLDNPPVQVLLMRATIKQSRHDFEGALTDLGRVIAAKPKDGQAYLTRAVVRQVRGDFPGAVDDCRTLARLTDGLAARACMDAVEGLSGKASESLQDLQSAYTTLAVPGDNGVDLWTLTLLAEMAERQGQDELAEQYFRKALAIEGKDGYLLGAYADFMLNRHRPAEVVSLLADLTRIDPLLLRVALAEQQLGSQSLAVHISDLEQRFAVARARGDRVHQREQARFTLFLLKKPTEALRLAQANWQVQREPADVRILLECALAADPAAADPVIAWLKDSRLQDVNVDALRRQLQKGRS
jgi:tetratricopeptide (TPR) repeat protein